MITVTLRTLYRVFNPEQSEGSLSCRDSFISMFTFWQALVELCTWDLLTIWRIEEHRLGLVDSFTKKYKVNRLMYYEIFRHADAADAREKQIKKYRREKKIA